MTKAYGLQCYFFVDFVCKQICDVLTPTTKAPILAWWTQETKVSLDRRKVMWKRIAPNVFDEKPTHFLMETQRSYFICTHILQYVLEFDTYFNGYHVMQR